MHPSISLISGKVPKWSSLRLLGESKVVSLTALVPFIGYALIFNSYVSSYIFPNNLTGGLNYLFNPHKLQIMYVGLSLVGFAAFMYKILRPRTANYVGASEYIIVEKAHATEAQSVVLFNRVTHACNLHFSKSSHNKNSIIDYSSSYMDSDASVLASEIFVKMGSEILQTEHDGQDVDEDDLTGQPKTVVFTYKKTNQQAVSKGLISDRGKTALKPFVHALDNRYRDIDFEFYNCERYVHSNLTDFLILDYMVFNHSQIKIRALIAFLYASGFSTLAWPTLNNFYVILRAMFYGY